MANTVLSNWRGQIETRLRSQSGLIGKVGWVTGGFAAGQVLRLISSVALAWLLSPALLGIMVLINSIKTGGELLSDVGIGQSVVKNPRGADEDFLNTAWTLGIIRGVILFALSFLAAGPLAALYDEPQLTMLLPAAAFVLVINGAIPPTSFVLKKRLMMKRLVIYRLSVAAIALIFQIALALITPTIWALIGGLWFSGTIAVIGGFFLLRDMRWALQLERSAVSEIISFGKWIFLSSLVYYFGMNFDRLYLASAVPLALLGVYGIAKTFSEIIASFFHNVANTLLFPLVSATQKRGSELREKLAGTRWLVLVGTAFMLAGIASIADLFITIVYDDRYLAAGTFLTILLAVTWFAILASIYDAIGMGIGRPGMVATSNAAKLAVLVVGFPLLLPEIGFVLALFVLVTGEAIRYSVLALRQRSVGLGFVRQDIAATVLFVVLAVVFREMTGLIGLTGGVEGWIEAVRVSDA